MALSKAVIVEAGLGILDAYGLADVTMRRVADALGVQAGALYYHVPNKQSLLAAVADELLREVAIPQADSPTQWLIAWASALRKVLLTHRDAAELVASTQALGMASDAAAPARAILREARYPEPDATAETFLHFVLGHVTQEQTRRQMRDLGVITDFDQDRCGSSFQWGLTVLERGLARL